MAKNRNLIESDTLTPSFSLGTIAYLKLLTRTHLYGKNPADTVERIVQAEIRRLIVSGELEKLRSDLPDLSQEQAADDSGEA